MWGWKDLETTTFKTLKFEFKMRNGGSKISEVSIWKEIYFVSKKLSTLWIKGSKAKNKIRTGNTKRKKSQKRDGKKENEGKENHSILAYFQDWECHNCTVLLLFKRLWWVDRNTWVKMYVQVLQNLTKITEQQKKQSSFTFPAISIYCDLPEGLSTTLLFIF